MLISGVSLPVGVRKFVQLASFSLHVLEQNPVVKPQRRKGAWNVLKAPIPDHNLQGIV